MLSQKDFETKGSKGVTWNYCIQIPHLPTSVVDVEQVNTNCVVINQTWYNTGRNQCPVYKSVSFQNL